MLISKLVVAMPGKMRPYVVLDPLKERIAALGSCLVVESDDAGARIHLALPLLPAHV